MIWSLRNKEGVSVASGLYIYVVRTQGLGQGTYTSRSKVVVLH
jgi:hypothetical protein